MVIDFQNIDRFTAFTTAFDIQKYRLSKKYNLQFEEMYDILFDDYLKNVINKYNPHQAFCFCKKRFDWALMDYLKKKPILYDFSNYSKTDIEYGKYNKPKKEPKYHTKRLGQPRNYIAGRPKKSISMYFKGKHIRDFESIAEANMETKIYKSNISDCCKGKRKSAGGYIWQFQNKD